MKFQHKLDNSITCNASKLDQDEFGPIWHIHFIPPCRDIFEDTWPEWLFLASWEPAPTEPDPLVTWLLKAYRYIVQSLDDPTNQDPTLQLVNRFLADHPPPAPWTHWRSRP